MINKLFQKQKLIDSLKIIPFSVDFIASKKCFNLPIQSLKLIIMNIEKKDTR